MYQITNIDKKLMLINIMYITTLFSLFTKLECKILSYQKLSLKLSQYFCIYMGTFLKVL